MLGTAYALLSISERESEYFQLPSEQINENALALLMSGHLHLCIWQMLLSKVT